MEAVILCGGRSKRMGLNKAFLPVGGRPIIEAQVEALRPIFDRILLVTRSPLEYAHLKLEIVEDSTPGSGALVGIYSGLQAVRGRAGFFVACDMPFLNPDLIRFMKRLSESFDVVIPQTTEGLEPTHAVYSRACLPAIAAQIARADYKIIRFFSQVRVRMVTQQETQRLDKTGLGLVNINTPGEYGRYCAEKSSRNIRGDG